ncbi:Aste57867_21712 [Aphanomyces stellatus]|uniref:Endonuclease III homolog n=1 Tax=Aphanomyces stellatus TaxID=120398 RepID=A0A485LI99_9STRA|nr:hypothetical protein As57867_021643 [Aphanomyces stellatus]VFT98381.1 Aste57867_21712 [Aphanomyces stellatus]
MRTTNIHVEMNGNMFAKFARPSAPSAQIEPRTAPGPTTSPPPSKKRKREHSASEDPSSTSTLLPTKKADRLAALDLLVDVRRGGTAPVDLYGTDRLIDSSKSPKSQRLHALVGALLSTQTKDEITAAAMHRLHKHDGGLTIDSLLAMSIADLDALLTPVGFHLKKAEQLRSIAATLRASYDDDVPRSVQALTGLPGIGPKVARLALLVAWDKVDGIIVDTHVHRIAGRLGWTRGAKDAEATRRELESWVPRARWGDMSKLMIGFGQTTCTAVKPKCSTCPLAMHCPYAVSKATATQATDKTQNRMRRNDV